jgi:hypothetical protein
MFSTQFLGYTFKLSGQWQVAVSDTLNWKPEEKRDYQF